MTATELREVGAATLDPDRRTPRRAARPWIALAIAAISAGFLQYLYAARAHFWLDDFRNLAAARRNGLSVSFLLSPVGDHLAPGHHLLDWLMIDVFNRDQRAGAAILALCIAGSVWLLGDLLATSFGRRRLHAVLGFFAGTAWLLVETGEWWAAAAHTFPAVLFTMGALAAYARWRHSRDMRWRRLAIVSMVAALLFWPQATVIPLYLLLLDVLVFERCTPLNWEVVKREATDLVAFVGVSVVYTAYLDLQPWHTNFSLPTTSEAVGFFSTMVFRGFPPNLVGTGLPVTPGDLWETFTWAVSIALIAIAIAIGVWCHRAVLRAALFFLISAVAAGIPIAVGRVVVDGPQVGNVPRYLTPLPFLFFFAVGLGVTPTRNAPAMPAARWTRRARVILAWVLVLTFSAYLLNEYGTSTRRDFGIQQGDAARTKTELIEKGLATARRRGELDSFLDTMMPYPIWYPGVSADGTLSHLAPYFTPRPDPIGEGNQLLTIGATGQVETASFVPLASSTTRHALRYVRLAIDARTRGTLRVGKTSVEYGPGAHSYVLPTWSYTATRPLASVSRGTSVTNSEIGTFQAVAPLR